VFAQGPQAQAALADAARVLTRKLSPEDLLYRLSSEVFGNVLPGATDTVARQSADRISEGLADTAGASNRFTAHIQVVNYPDHANSASEMERRASSLVNEERIAAKQVAPWRPNPTAFHRPKACFLGEPQFVIRVSRVEVCLGL
jgi:GGDEF domain-containing protein